MTTTQTTQPLTVAVSLADVTRRVLAISALQAVADTSTPMPPLLLPGHAKALAEASRQAFNIIALQLGSLVEAVDTGSADSGILAMTLRPGVAVPAAGMAEPLATAMAFRVISIAMAGHDSARAAGAAAEADTILSRLTSARCAVRASYGSVTV